MSNHINKIKSMNPATGEILGEVPISRKKDVELTIEKAKDAFFEWSRLSYSERAEFMIKIRNKMLQRKEEILDIIVKETGKPKLEALIHDFHLPLEDLEYYSKKTEKFLQNEKVKLGFALRDKKSNIVFEPVGVIGIILPWNFPVLLWFHSMIPALMAGNTVVIKPSEHTPLCTLKIHEIINESGLPKNIVNILPGDGTTGNFLVESDVDRIVFIGSVSTGKQVMKNASSKLHPLVLELGGKDPAIVCSDADLEWATSGIIWNSMFNTGQACSSIERVYVMHDIAEEFTEMIVEKTKQLKVGNGLNAYTEIGPLIAKFQLNKIIKHIEDAKKEGAKILTGGKILGEKGSLFYAPTILTNVNHNMLIMKQETFGPILPIMSVKSEDEAIRLANDTKYGLSASVWTKDLIKGQRIAKKIKAGYVCINNRGVETASLPWGGTKESGFGKISSRFGLLNYVNIKCIIEDHSNKNKEDWWYPYNEPKYEFYTKIIQNFHSDTMLGKLKAGSQLLKGSKD